jgi:hypothetical protein
VWHENEPDVEDVGVCAHRSGDIEHTGIAVGISSISHSKPKLQPLPVYQPPSEFPDVGQYYGVSVYTAFDRVTLKHGYRRWKLRRYLVSNQFYNHHRFLTAIVVF